MDLDISPIYYGTAILKQEMLIGFSLISDNYDIFLFVESIERWL